MTTKVKLVLNMKHEAVAVRSDCGGGESVRMRPEKFAGLHQANAAARTAT
jgi:hypothetical protein